MKSIIDVNPQSKFFFSAPVELIISKLWKDKHALEFGLAYSIGFRPIGKGYYIYFPEKPEPSFGTISITNTYIALHVVYTFWRGKRKPASVLKLE